MKKKRAYVRLLTSQKRPLSRPFIHRPVIGGGNRVAVFSLYPPAYMYTARGLTKIMGV